ncbi:FUSC family protein [Kribbella sp. NPDC058693]|uniref:FUSC family protein n=1 Tax=Kribbella sp. NPDC058693 TaxID=3346602 RepID=UPI0036516DB8
MPPSPRSARWRSPGQRFVSRSWGWSVLAWSSQVLRWRGGSLLRATQRCAGTCVGVLIGGLLILWAPLSWVIVVVVGILGGLRPLLKERNYAAYATVMTPLVVLLMDLGRTPELSTVRYRLIDTVIGCLIAIVPTLLLRRRHVG